MEKTQNTPLTTKATGKAMRLIRKMLLSPLNHASCGVKSDVFCIFLNGFGYTCEALFVLCTILFLSHQPQSIAICTVFQASNQKILLTSHWKQCPRRKNEENQIFRLTRGLQHTLSKTLQHLVCEQHTRHTVCYMFQLVMTIKFS